MDARDRSFTISEMQAARDEADRQIAALQRRADALRKMAEAAEELEAAERELSADSTAEAAPTTEQASLPDPGSTGRRAQVILQSDTSRSWTPRDVWERMVELGWAEATKDARVAIRVSLTRLDKREPRITRTPTGMTYGYQWVDADTNAQSSNGRAPTLGLEELNMRAE
jgi:hypothetical protein